MKTWTRSQKPKLQRISQNDNTQVDYPAQSIFDRPELRGENGWDVEIDWIEIKSVSHTLKHIWEITNSNFGEDWAVILASYLGKSILSQTSGVFALYGFYYHAMNAKNGIIIAIDSKSPISMRKTRAEEAGEPVEHIPTTTLQKWSDITYLSWHAQCTESSTPLKNLKHIIRSHITNPETTLVIEEILNEEHINCPPDGLKIDINDSKGYGAALPGTPNGKGVGWLLAQHKNQLGNPKIVSVEIFHSLCVPYHHCNKDTGELITEGENVRVEECRDFLNLDFTIQCG
ncbi:hypothetical protein EAE96_009010 [Botrytis aclada]|nr:hypothetical protein EAE96_009010 [Botrytis aclada]